MFSPQAHLLPGTFSPRSHLLPGMFDPQSHLLPGTFSPQAHLTPSTFGPHGICLLMFDGVFIQVHIREDYHYFVKVTCITWQL